MLSFLNLCRKQHLIFGYIAELPGGSSGLNKGALAGIILGTIAGSVTLSAIVALLILRRYTKKHNTPSRRRPCEYLSHERFLSSTIFHVVK